jgi:hypothetical protein
MSVTLAPAATPARRLAFTATCLYVAAYLLTIMVHELGHALTSWSLGGQPVLHNTSVDTLNHAALPVATLVRITAAGPLVSLAQGLTLLWHAHRTRATGAGALFGLYLGVFGVINFLGYLMISPLVPGGDTGQLVALLHVPAGVQWATAALALVLLMRLIRGTGPLFVQQLAAPAQHEAGARQAGLQALLLWPWAVGSAVLVLLAVPAPQLSILLNLPMSSLVLFGAYRAGQRQPAPALAAAPAWWQASWLPLLAAGGLALLFRLLGPGITL